MLILLTISVLVLGGIGGYYGHGLWTDGGTAGITMRNMKKVFLLAIVMLLTVSAFAQSFRRHHRRHHHPHHTVDIAK
jgi:hypothetical protein